VRRAVHGVFLKQEEEEEEVEENQIVRQTINIITEREGLE